MQPKGLLQNTLVILLSWLRGIVVENEWKMERKSSIFAVYGKCKERKMQ